MRRSRTALRVGGWVLFSSVLAIGVAVGYPGGWAGAAHDVLHYHRHAADLADGLSEHRQIDSAMIAARDRYEFKQALCDQLAVGSVRLTDAAAHYFALVAAEPSVLAQFRDTLPGATDEERIAASLVREVFVEHPLSADTQFALLEQFRTAYRTDYPFPVPAPRASTTPLP